MAVFVQGSAWQLKEFPFKARYHLAGDAVDISADRIFPARNHRALLTEIFWRHSQTSVPSLCASTRIQPPIS